MINNIIKLAGGVWVAQIISMITNVILIRSLNVEDYAKFSMSITVVTICTSAILSFFNRQKILNKSSVNGIEVFYLILISCILIYLYSIYIEQSFDMILYSICIGCGVITTEAIKTSKQNKNDFSKMAAINMLRSFIYFCVVLVFYFVFNDGLSITCVVFALVISHLIVFINNKNEIGQNVKSNKTEVEPKKIFLMLYFMILPSFAQFPFLMLSKEGDNYQVAVFATAMTFILVFNTVLIAMKKVFIVNLRDGFEKKDIFKILASSCILLTITYLFMLNFGEQVFNVISSGKYSESNEIFLILIWSVFLSLLLSPFSELLQLKEKYRYQFISLCFTFAFCLIFSNYFFEKIDAIKIAYVYLASNFILNFSFMCGYFRYKHDN